MDGFRYGMASVKGSFHSNSNLPNQDAYAVFTVGDTTVAAVADGLGSRPLSHFGAQEAVTIAAFMVMEYLLADSAHTSSAQTLEELKHGIVRTWRARFGKQYPGYDSTLLLAGLSDNKVLLAQIGDGLIVTCDGNGRCLAFSQPAKPFLNVTDSLASRDVLRAFKIDEIAGETTENMVALFLMTDGVADDIEDLASFCGSSLAALNQCCCHWNQIIESWLAAWPTPGNYDDKTMIVVSRTVPGRCGGHPKPAAEDVHASAGQVKPSIRPITGGKVMSNRDNLGFPQVPLIDKRTRRQSLGGFVLQLGHRVRLKKDHGDAVAEAR